MESPLIREGLLQEQVGKRVRCLTCERRCLVGPGQTGWCRTRQNLEGTLYTLTYGLVASLSANPIEKKPLHHFYPGSVALTAGSLSCNLDCPWCQNWELSKHAPPAIDSGSPQHWTTGEYYTPEHFVDEAIERNCQGTSISLNEPTLSLEWSLEVFRLARQRGLYNTFVTNGYMTDIALEHLARAGLDGMNVDLKGDAQAVRAHCGADVEPIWRNLRRAQEQGIWVEVTTLIVPGVNAERAVWAGIAERILQELGPDVPWHVSRYHPAYRCSEPPTPVKVLEQIRATARERGLKYVYIGNVAGHPAEHTYCPACGEMLIQRWAVWSVANRMEQERCPRCGEKIAGRW